MEAHQTYQKKQIKNVKQQNCLFFFVKELCSLCVLRCVMCHESLCHIKNNVTHIQKILSEKNFKIGVFKVCGIDFKDPLL